MVFVLHSSLYIVLREIPACVCNSALISPGVEYMQPILVKEDI